MNQNLKQATLSDKVPNPTKRKIILIQMENRIICILYIFDIFSENKI